MIKNILKCSTIYSGTLICQRIILPFGRDREVESSAVLAIPVRLATLTIILILMLSLKIVQKSSAFKEKEFLVLNIF
jgi:hypothetical protein